MSGSLLVIDKSPPLLSLTLTSSSLRDCLTLAHLATTSHVISLSWRISPPRPRSCVPPVLPSAPCRTHSLSSQRTFHLIFLALLVPSARQLLPSPLSRPLQRCSALTHPRSLSRRSALPPPPSTLSMLPSLPSAVLPRPPLRWQCCLRHRWSPCGAAAGIALMTSKRVKAARALYAVSM